MNAAKTNAERQREFRARKAAERKRLEAAGLKMRKVLVHEEDWDEVSLWVDYEVKRRVREHQMKLRDLTAA